MKLTDLQPRWLINEPGRRLLLFKNPTGGDAWLTCKNFQMPLGEQMALIREKCPDLKGLSIVGTDPQCAWTITGEFENLTCMPSIDASRSGNWHGFIRNGEIV